MKTPLIEIRNLSISFPKTGYTAVSEISFTIEKGERVGIVGESGSGKTLTALSLIGLLPGTSKSSGDIIYHKEEGKINLREITSKSFLEIRGKHIGMIFQEPMSSLNPAMRCGKQVTEILKEHNIIGSKEAREEVLRLFGEVNLPRPAEIFKSYPHQLSGGQRQRVMIAMAIACKPDLLIADEPTTALDVTVQKIILELLVKLNKKFGISILLISHDLGVIASFAEKLLVMYKGEIVEQGKTSGIISDPINQYTKGLLACRPPLSGRPHRLLTLKDFTGEAREIMDTRDDEGYKGKLIGDEEKTKGELLMKVSGLTTSFALKRNLLGNPVGEVQAVNDVSFELFRGETLGLVGESGCGKTSLGRSILQLIKTRQGEISYKGVRIDELKGISLRKFRKNMQIIFQDPYSSLNPGLTAGEAIIEPMVVHKLHSSNSERREKAYQLMERVALDKNHFNRYPHQFSGGQLQRIGIARALAVEPEMIICDESVSALDVSVQAQILNLLNELKEDFGLTYLFISHDLAVVRYMSDRLMVMQNGIIVESGDSDQIFSKPEKEYTRMLMDAVPRLERD